MTLASSSSPAPPAPAGSREGDRPLRGVALMVFASLVFAAMNAVASYLGRAHVPWSTVAFARALVGLVAAALLARARGISLAVRDRRTLAVRAVAGTGSMLCTFYALSHLPLADATALLNTTPLWTTLLAVATLREPPGRVVLACLAVAVTGIFFVERPAFAVGNAAGAVAVLAGATTAVAMVSLRKLSGESPEGVVVQFSAFATCVLAAIVGAGLVREGVSFAVSTPVLAGLALVGVLATVGQLAMTRAYALDRAARVGAAGWSQVLFALALDGVFFARVPPPLTVAGIALLVVAGVVLVWDAGREQARRAAGPAAQ